MRVLVTWGSKLGGTVGIARTIGAELEGRGLQVALLPASKVRELRGFDAAIVGGALYANRWHRDAYRFVSRNLRALRQIPVWLFSDGPLDDSADRRDIPPPPQLDVLRQRVGALGHVTFGGRLSPDAKGFPASAMAKKLSGDWRNMDRVRAWAAEIARNLPKASPGIASDFPAASPWRLLAHGVVGWAACAAIMAALLQAGSTGLAIAVHAVAAPLVFAAIAVSYFRARGARDPLPTALAFTATVAVLDAAVVAALVLHSFAMFWSIAGTWLPFLLIFLVTWATGTVMSMIPARPAQSTGTAHTDRDAGRGNQRQAATGA